MPNKTKWKRRRLASRSVKIVERHKDAIASVRAFELTLVPAAQAYMTTHDQLRTMETLRGVEVAEGQQATAVLNRKNGAWKGQIAADGTVAGFDLGAYGSRPTVPEDVIADTEALIDVVKKHKETNPESLPFADIMLEDLTPALESARKESLEAQALRSEHQLLVEQNRENAERFDALIIGLRQTLAAELGRSHPDYQALRASKIDRNMPEDEEDDVELDGEPEDPEDPTDDDGEDQGDEPEMDEVANG